MAGYTCNTNEFVYSIGEDGKVSMSGYKLKCKRLENNENLISTNIFDGLSAPIFVSHDEQSESNNNNNNNGNLISREIFTDLIGLLDKKDRVKNDCYSRKNTNNSMRKFTRRVR